MTTHANDGYYEVLWPRSPMQVQGKSLAKRLDTLEGKTIVQLWDYVFKGDQVFAALEDSLAAKYPGVNFVHWSVIGNTHGPEERQILADLPRRLRELKADAVISGMGC